MNNIIQKRSRGCYYHNGDLGRFFKEFDRVVKGRKEVEILGKWVNVIYG